MNFLTTEDINRFVEVQLEEWDEARNNFFALSKVARRQIPLGDLRAIVQHNPARILSTGAKIDRRSIADRPCFLCSSNRPAEQITVEWPEGWHLLVNPYPILPVHFTIASTRHEPQEKIPLDMAVMAEHAPDLVFFFNGAHAGASAPDHLHVQAVLKTELPLIALAEANHDSGKGGFMSSEEFGLNLPFHFISGVISPDSKGMRTLAKLPDAFGIDSQGNVDTGLVNTFFWIGTEGLLRIIIVPRKAHRPSCYSTDKPDGFVISPGAIDMSGLMVAPLEKDYIRLDEQKMKVIYAETAYAEELPQEIKRYFGI